MAGNGIPDSESAIKRHASVSQSNQTTVGLMHGLSMQERPTNGQAPLRTVRQNERYKQKECLSELIVSELFIRINSDRYFTLPAGHGRSRKRFYPVHYFTIIKVFRQRSIAERRLVSCKGRSGNSANLLVRA